jgi:hypothetical protein
VGAQVPALDQRSTFNVQRPTLRYQTVALDVDVGIERWTLDVGFGVVRPSSFFTLPYLSSSFRKPSPRAIRGAWSTNRGGMQRFCHQQFTAELPETLLQTGPQPGRPTGTDLAILL